MAKRRSRGDGAIYYDEKRGLYVGQINLGYDENGKRKRKTVYGNTKTEVKTKLKSVEYQIYTGAFVDKSQITFYHLAKQLLDDKLNQNEIKESTYLRNTETLKILKPIYNIRLQDLTETQIRHFLNNNLDYSQSTLNKIYEILSRTIAEAHRRKIIAENPIAFIKRPNSKKATIKVRALSKDEQRKFIHILQTEDIPYSRQMLLSLALGLRMGEINALHTEDINFTFNRITVHRTISKGKKGEAVLNETTKTPAGTRILTMTSAIHDLLEDCTRFVESGLIFTHKEKMITTNQVNLQFARVIKKYNILDERITNGKVNLHSLRHTFGTRCAEAGMPPKVLQEIMGHTDIRITMNTYFYTTQDYLQDNLSRINSILENEGLTIGQQATMTGQESSSRICLN